MAASTGSSGATGASGASGARVATIDKVGDNLVLRWLRKSRDETALQRKVGDKWEDVPTEETEAEAPTEPAKEEGASGP